MARRKRSLLGSSSRSSTGLPLPPRSVLSPQATGAPADPPPAEPESASAPLDSGADEGVSDPLDAPPVGAAPEQPPPAEPAARVDDDALVEDDAPIVGSDLQVPPIDEGDDSPGAPEQALGPVHNPPPSPAPAPPRALSDVLVLFDEQPGEHPLPEPVVHVDDNPPGFDASAGLRAGTPEPARPRALSPRPAPGLADDDWFRDEEGDLPTEEAHPSTIEDFAALYRAPMNVPEPPPIPGILDRFTPAPASLSHERAGATGGEGSIRPEFVPEPPRGVAGPGVPKPRGVWDETPLPTDGRSSEDSASAGRSVGGGARSPVWQDPMFLAIVLGSFLFAIVVLLGLAYLMGGPAQAPAPRTIEPASVAPMVPVPVVQRPAADLAPAMPSDSDNDPADEEPLGADDAGASTEPPAGDPGPAPDVPEVRLPPARPVAPRVAKPSADVPGKLIIRATRAQLVYVNGQPVGMSPAEVERPAGVYTVHITEKGKRIERRVDLEAGATRTVDF